MLTMSFFKKLFSRSKKRFVYSSHPEDYGYVFSSETGNYYDPESVGDEDGIRQWDYDFPDNEDDLYNIKEYLDNNRGPWILTGYLGLWDGRHGGYAIVRSYKELMDAISVSGQSDTEINDEDGDLTIIVHHHDGSNCFTLRELTDKGRQWYENNEYSGDMNHLLEVPTYTRKIRFADKVFGKI